jgi:single-strand DNA-binding protein
MSNSLNRAYLIGHLGRDPWWAQHTTNRLMLSLATTRSIRGRDGTWTQVTDWHELTAFGHIATYLHRSACKGALLGVEATLVPVRMTLLNDQVVDVVEIHVTAVTCLRRPVDRAEAGMPQAVRSPPPPPPAPPLPEGAVEINDDDIPF